MPIIGCDNNCVMLVAFSGTIWCRSGPPQLKIPKKIPKRQVQAAGSQSFVAKMALTRLLFSHLCVEDDKIDRHWATPSVKSPWALESPCWSLPACCLPICHLGHENDGAGWRSTRDHCSWSPMRLRNDSQMWGHGVGSVQQFLQLTIIRFWHCDLGPCANTNKNNQGVDRSSTIPHQNAT